MNNVSVPARGRSIVINLLIALAVTLLTILATVAADRVVGLFLGKRPISSGLIFEHNTSAYYHTMEFDYTATANALGFRDHEYAVADGSTCRVAAIGDLFTFGWGVSLEELWPKVLEASLRRSGFNVEVANLGFPGGNPIDYANIAEHALPILKPDLVVVAALQGDDLHMSGGARVGAEGRMAGVRRALDPIARMLYPNFLAIFDAHTYRRTALINTVWAEQAHDALSGFNPAEKDRYDKIDFEVRRAFESGNLNPSIIPSAIRHPEYFIEVFDVRREETQALIKQMSAQFSRIRNAAESDGGGMIVASMPFSLYVNRQEFEVRQNKYGFILDREMLTSNSPDDEICQAADGAGVPFYSFTEAFRKMDGTPLFFRLDGHLNASGHRFYAEQLAPDIATKLKGLGGKCASGGSAFLH